MGSYRPLCDTWILARSKVKYYGSFPAGFLHRARTLIGAGYTDSVLHVCAGKVRDYPYRGFCELDRTLDLDPECRPDYLRDARQPLPQRGGGFGPWKAILIDRPYTLEDADKYKPGRGVLPTANELVRNGIQAVEVGSKVGILDYIWPQPPKNATEVAVITVVTGRNNRARLFTVFERLS